MRILRKFVLIEKLQYLSKGIYARKGIECLQEEVLKISKEGWMQRTVHLNNIKILTQASAPYKS